MSDSFSDERADHEREEWQNAKNKYSLNPLYDPNKLMEFMVEQQRSHNPIKK